MIALNLFNPFSFGYDITFFDLFVFTSGSIIVVNILLYYYTFISKKQIFSEKVISSEHTQEVYFHDLEFTPTKKLSVFSKALLTFFIITLIITPFQQFINFDYFL